MNKIQRAWSRFHSKHLEKRKLRFVTWFDKKFPGKYCWADCVSWAYSPRAFNPFKIDSCEACKLQKILNAGLTVLDVRKQNAFSDNSTFSIWQKNISRQEWHQFEKGFTTRAAVKRRLKELIDDSKTIDLYDNYNVL